MGPKRPRIPSLAMLGINVTKNRFRALESLETIAANINTLKYD